jgi:2-methylaconitate cis-trans-isomerase PrpF
MYLVTTCLPAYKKRIAFGLKTAEEEGARGAMLPTGNLVDDLEVPGIGTLKATMINAGIPTIFLHAQATRRNGEWVVTKTIMSRSARVLTEGWVRVPDVGT